MTPLHALAPLAAGLSPALLVIAALCRFGAGPLALSGDFVIALASGGGMFLTLARSSLRAAPDREIL